MHTYVHLCQRHMCIPGPDCAESQDLAECNRCIHQGTACPDSSMCILSAECSQLCMHGPEIAESGPA